MREVEGEEDAPQDAVHPQLRDAVAVEVAAEDRVEGAADEDGRPRVAPVVEQLPQRRARAGPPSLQRRVGHSHSLSLPLPHYTQYVFQGIGYKGRYQNSGTVCVYIHILLLIWHELKTRIVTRQSHTAYLLADSTT